MGGRKGLPCVAEPHHHRVGRGHAPGLMRCWAADGVRATTVRRPPRTWISVGGRRRLLCGCCWSSPTLGPTSGAVREPRQWRHTRSPPPSSLVVLTVIARRPFRVRWHLVALLLISVVPLLIFTVVIVLRHLDDQREILQSGTHATARALTVATNREIRVSLGILETLAASPALQGDDLKGFYDLCVRAVAGRKDTWILLFDQSGQQLVNSSRPFGSALPNPLLETKPPSSDPRYPFLPLGGADPVRKVFETGQPVVSDLFVALDSRRPTIGIAIPIVRDGTVVYVLEMSVDPDALLRVLMDQGPHDDSVVSLLDSHGLIIARTLDQQRLVGLPLEPDLMAHLAKSGDGSGLGHTREGSAVFHVFNRSTITGWTISFGVSQAVIAASRTRSFVLLSGGAALALLAGLGAAVFLGKRISTPLSLLAGEANAVARGDRVEMKMSALQEVEDLRGALVTAGEAARNAAADREQRLVAETKRDEAQAANRAKDEFLAMVSHELRTPMNAVFGWARMLHLGHVSDEEGRQRALDAIVRNAHAQVQLIDDLLDMSRIISGKMRLDVRPVDLRAVVEAALDAVRPAADSKQIRLEAMLDPRAGPLMGDPDRLQQVVWNLLTNAIKFTPKAGRVQVHLR